MTFDAIGACLPGSPTIWLESEPCVTRDRSNSSGIQLDGSTVTQLCGLDAVGKGIYLRLAVNE